MTRARGRGGFILVSALGVLVVLAGLAGSVAYLTRTAAVGAAGLKQDLALDALARAGVELAGFQLFMLRRPAAEVNAQRLRMNDGVVTLFVAGEAGKVDLNGASPELLAGLWRSVGSGSMPPDQFAARVMDYRDPDGDRGKKGGAEAAEYAAAGPDRRPADAPFQMADELQNVLGISPSEAKALAPFVTVHNPSGKVSGLDAPPEVLKALPDIAASLVDRVLTMRKRPTPDLAEQLKTALGDKAGLIGFEPGAAFTVIVEIERGAARRSVRTILTASAAPDALYFVTDRERWTGR